MHKTKSIQVMVDPGQRQLVREVAFELETSVSAAARALIEEGLALRKMRPDPPPSGLPPLHSPKPVIVDDLLAYFMDRWGLEKNVAIEIIVFVRTNPLPEPTFFERNMMMLDPHTGRYPREGVFDVPPLMMSDPAMLKAVLLAQVGPPHDSEAEQCIARQEAGPVAPWSCEADPPRGNSVEGVGVGAGRHALPTRPDFDGVIE